MLTKSLFSLTAFLGYSAAQGSGAYVHNLDDETHVQRISFTGLNLSQYNRESYLSVTSDSGSTAQGYTWLIDYDDCEGIVDITSSIAYYPSTNPNVDNGYSEEIFTLTAGGFGTCDFTIAYAIPWQFTSFSKFEKQGGLVISIPIRVVDGDENPSGGEATSGGSSSGGSSTGGSTSGGSSSGSSSGSSGSSSGSSSTDSWINPNQSADKDWSGERHDFWVFGWVEWFRAIFFAHVISDLPTAFSWSRLKNGHLYGAGTFKWLARWYSEIAGWAASIVNMAVAGVLLARGIDDYNKNGAETYTYTECTNLGYYWGTTCREKEGTVLSGWTAAAGAIFTWEIVTWFLYYIYRHGAYRYADMLDQQKDQYY